MGLQYCKFPKGHRVFLIFAPLYGLVLFANLSPAGRIWRWLAQSVAVGVNMLLLTGGVLVAIGGVIREPTLLTALPQGADITTFGIMLTITGIVGFLLMLQRIQVRLYPALRWKLDPENTLHTIAVQLAIWAIGGNLASILLTRTVPAEILTASVDAVSLGAIWEQGAVFVFLAVLGVGLGLRRGWNEARERLGVGGLSAMQIVILPALIIGLVLLQAGISLLWLLTDPDSLTRINELSGSLFTEETMTIMGALTIGLSAGIGEELLMRGAVQPRFGIIFTTLLFTVLHTQYEFSFATLIVLVLSLVLGLVRHYFNTTACIIIHAGYNALLVLASLAAESFM
jgi:membrane protease YdiL (CAAX protease family)